MKSGAGKGIKILNGKYSVDIRVTPYPKKYMNIHIGTFEKLEQAEKTYKKADALRKTLKGDALMDALDEIRMQNVNIVLICCGKRMSPQWAKCPYCGKNKKEILRISQQTEEVSVRFRIRPGFKKELVSNLLELGYNCELDAQ